MKISKDDVLVNMVVQNDKIVNLVGTYNNYGLEVSDDVKIIDNFKGINLDLDYKYGIFNKVDFSYNAPWTIAY